MAATNSHIILLRHGSTEFNKQGRFTGQLDIPLAPEGYLDSAAAAQKLKHSRFIPDVIYVSPLQRTQQSAQRICEELGISLDRIVIAPEIIERDSGALAGLSRTEAELTFGKDTVHACDTSFSTRCPDKDATHPGESVADVERRVQLFMEKQLQADIRAGRNVLVLGHENSLRAVGKILGNLSPEQAMQQFISSTQPVGYTAKVGIEGNISITPYAESIQQTTRSR